MIGPNIGRNGGGVLGGGVLGGGVDGAPQSFLRAVASGVGEESNNGHHGIAPAAHRHHALLAEHGQAVVDLAGVGVGVGAEAGVAVDMRAGTS